MIMRTIVIIVYYYYQYDHYFINYRYLPAVTIIYSNLQKIDKHVL